MSLLERALLAIAILEIPLQIDKYFMYQPDDAKFGAIGGFNVSLATLCLVPLYSMWIVKAVTNPIRSRDERGFVWGGVLPIYVLMIGVSACYALDPMLTLFDLWNVIQAYMLYVYLANRIQGAADIKFVLLVLAISLVIQAIIVIWLWMVSGGTANVEFNLGPVQMMIFEDGRPCGTLYSPVLAGSFLAMLIIPTSVLTMVTESRWGRILAGAAVGVGVLGLGLTQTRGAVLGLILGGSIFGFSLFRRGMLPKNTFWYIAILTLISIFPLVQLIQNRVLQGDQGSAASRIHLAQIALRVIGEHSLLGVGSGNCHLAMQEFADSSKFRGEWFYTVHSKYLLVWVETGIVGLLLFLAFIGDTLRRSWLAFRFGDRVVGVCALAVGAGIIGHVFHMSIDVFNSRPQVQFLWACSGIVAACYGLASRATTLRPRTNSAGAMDFAGGWDVG